MSKANGANTAKEEVFGNWMISKSRGYENDRFKAEVGFFSDFLCVSVHAR